MKIGCLGDIAFEVSDSIVRTIDNLNWSGSVSISTHSLHLDNAIQEFVGIDPDSFTMTIHLSAYLGVNPMEEISKIWEYERGGIAIPLTIGHHAYGKYRWLIKSHKTKAEHFDGKGDITSATVDITLTEYIKE